MIFLLRMVSLLIGLKSLLNKYSFMFAHILPSSYGQGLIYNISHKYAIGKLKKIKIILHKNAHFNRKKREEMEKWAERPENSYCIICKMDV